MELRNSTSDLKGVSSRFSRWRCWCSASTCQACMSSSGSLDHSLLASFSILVHSPGGCWTPSPSLSPWKTLKPCMLKLGCHAKKHVLAGNLTQSNENEILSLNPRCGENLKARLAHPSSHSVSGLFLHWPAEAYPPL